MDDNVELLKECDAGVKMGIDGISQVIANVDGENLKNLLENYEKQHKKLEGIISTKLQETGEDGKEPNAFGKAGSWFNINMKMFINDSDEKIADVMIDGCNMGIKSVSRYMNEYAGAQKDVMDIANDVVVLEQHFMNELRQYL